MKNNTVKKLAKIILVLLVFYFIPINSAHAEVLASCKNDFGVTSVLFNGGEVPNKINAGEVSSYTLRIRGNSLVDGSSYSLIFRNGISPITLQTRSVESQQLVFTVDQQNVLFERGQKTLQLQNPSGEKCDLIQYDVSTQLKCESLSLSQAGYTNPGCFDKQSGDITLTANGLTVGGLFYTGSVIIDDSKLRVLTGTTAGTYPTVNALNGTATYTFGVGTSVAAGTGHIISMKSSLSDEALCQVTFNLQEAACTEEARNRKPQTNPEIEAAPFKICSQILDQSLKAQCTECAEGEGGQAGVWTAIGCIKRDPISIAQRLIGVGLGMAGGVALITTLAGAFILSTSQGEPQKANQAKELITNSIIGLLFVIFSVVILQFIGVTILQIPGFGAPPK